MCCSRTAWTYEELRQAVASIPLPKDPIARETLWVVESVMGIARTSGGGVEIFLIGERLHTKSGTVRRHMEHGTWSGTSHATVTANRVVLPAEEHFISISALIGTEMLRFGAGTDRPLQQVFDDVEPILELALRRGALGEDVVLGLLGELLVLEQMLAAVSSEAANRSSVLDMWRGHQPGERDFVIGSVGIEVKATRNDSSSHHIASLRQIELNESESRLYLLSVGLAASVADGQTLPQVVERVAAFLGGGKAVSPRSALQDRFLRDVSAYRVGGSVGYDHLTMSGWAPYQVQYRSTFTPRLYDVQDPHVRLVRSFDIADRMVVPASLNYDVDLPVTVSPRNPEPDWSKSLARLTQAALGNPISFDGTVGT